MVQDENFKITKLSNVNALLIKKKSEELCSNIQSKVGQAITIFHFVRDNIKFGGSNIFGSASETLQALRGDCGIKSNLQMTLLRSAGIPSRLHTLLVKRDVLKGIWPQFVVALFPQEAAHIYCECKISDKWIACESTLDKQLYHSLLKGGNIQKNQIPSIEWDGINSCTLFDNWKIRDLSDCYSYEEVIESFAKIKGRGGFPPLYLKPVYSLVGMPINFMVNTKIEKKRRYI